MEILMLDPIFIGNILEYKITITNTSLSDYHNVNLVDKLPSDTAFLLTSTTKGSYYIKDDILTFNIGNLSPDEKVEINLKIKPLKIGIFTNSATLSAKELSYAISSSVTFETTYIGTKLSTEKVKRQDKQEILTIFIKNSTSNPIEIPTSILSLACKENVSDYEILYIGKYNFEYIEKTNLPCSYELIFDNVIEGVTIEVKACDSSFKSRNLNLFKADI